MDTYSLMAQVPVFVDSNLGTHIVTVVSADTTAGEFKRKLEIVHLNCLPELGEITVNAIMVKRKSCLYHLPESFPLKQVFSNSKRAWFIVIKAHLRSESKQPVISKLVSADVVDCITKCSNVDGIELQDPVNAKRNTTKSIYPRRMKGSFCVKAAVRATLDPVNSTRIINSTRTIKTKKKWKKVFQNFHSVNELEKAHCSGNEGFIKKEKFTSIMKDEGKQTRNPSPDKRSPSVTCSESICISSLINKYFPTGDEVTSNPEVSFAAKQNQYGGKLKKRTNSKCFTACVDITPKFTARTLSHFPLSKGHVVKSRSMPKRSDVGKRLLVASNNLGFSSDFVKPAVSLRRRQDGNLAQHKPSLVRALVFELPSDDD